MKIASLEREGDQRSWWRDTAEIFCIMFQIYAKIPQSACGCQLPFQGSLNNKGEPN